MEIKQSMSLVSSIVQLTHYSPCHGRQSGSSGEVGGCLLKDRSVFFKGRSQLATAARGARLLCREEQTGAMQLVGAV